MREQDIKQMVEANFQGSTARVQKKGRIIVTLVKESAPGALIFFKANGFDHLSAISCTDWLKEDEFELVYHLWSYTERIHAMIKTRIPRSSPVAISSIPVFEHAQTYEREIHEMFGVNFEGNPRLIPMFLENWQGPPPMRKDFNTREHVKNAFGMEDNLR